MTAMTTGRKTTERLRRRIAAVSPSAPVVTGAGVDMMPSGQPMATKSGPWAIS
jgi:hypothetical protein